MPVLKSGLYKSSQVVSVSQDLIFCYGYLLRKALHVRDKSLELGLGEVSLLEHRQGHSCIRQLTARM